MSTNKLDGEPTILQWRFNKTKGKNSEKRDNICRVVTGFRNKNLTVHKQISVRQKLATTYRSSNMSSICQILPPRLSYLIKIWIFT
jgi:hypothetical protein